MRTQTKNNRKKTFFRFQKFLFQKTLQIWNLNVSVQKQLVYERNFLLILRLITKTSMSLSKYPVTMLRWSLISMKINRSFCSRSSRKFGRSSNQQKPCNMIDSEQSFEQKNSKARKLILFLIGALWDDLLKGEKAAQQTHTDTKLWQQHSSCLSDNKFAFFE